MEFVLPIHLTSGGTLDLTGKTIKNGLHIVAGARRVDITGTHLADTLEGSDAKDTLRGADGVDLLYGNGANDLIDAGDRSDTVWAGTGNDTLSGGAGSDQLGGELGDDVLIGGPNGDTFNGGPGRDRYVFGDITDSPRSVFTCDLIIDFTPGEDLIDLAGIDADETKPGDQAFAFGGSQAGQIRVTQEFINFDYRTVVELSVDADPGADMLFSILGRVSLSANDFVL
jgi:Ca2+-binding RTX toxin-like protein